MADNELALVGGAINASTVSEALTAQLEEALLSATDAREAARKVAARPALLAEARTQLSLVSRLAAPVTPDELYVALQPLVIMYGPPDFGQDAEAVRLQQAWFDLYYGVLKDHPKEAIEIAVQQVLATNKWKDFPKPAEINGFALETSAEIKLIAFRLRKAVERSAEHRPVKKTPEDAAAVAQMVESLRGPDGKIHVTKTAASATPKTDRSATAEALRRLSDYQ